MFLAIEWKPHLIKFFQIIPPTPSRTSPGFFVSGKKSSRGTTRRPQKVKQSNHRRQEPKHKKFIQKKPKKRLFSYRKRPRNKKPIANNLLNNGLIFKV
jgi:hypothetical protein